MYLSRRLSECSFRVKGTFLEVIFRVKVVALGGVVDPDPDPACFLSAYGDPAFFLIVDPDLGPVRIQILKFNFYVKNILKVSNRSNNRPRKVQKPFRKEENPVYL
jgi:hypothetical protein